VNIPLNCPNCGTQMRATVRFGIEIDYCPSCKGIWLDKGELDKIIQREKQHYRDDIIGDDGELIHYDDRHQYGKEKRDYSPSGSPYDRGRDDRYYDDHHRYSKEKRDYRSSGAAYNRGRDDRYYDERRDDRRFDDRRRDDRRDDRRSEKRYDKRYDDKKYRKKERKKDRKKSIAKRSKDFLEDIFDIFD